MFKEPRHQKPFDWMIPRDIFLINRNIDVFISCCKRDLNKHCTVSTRTRSGKIMEAKKIKFDSIQKMNDEMTEFLDQFPEESKDMQKTLTQKTLTRSWKLKR